MLNSTTCKTTYTIQDGVSSYPIGFEFVAPEHVAITIDGASGILGIDYMVSDGNVIIEGSYTGKTLVISRATPFTQESDYQVGRINPEQIEYDFDRSAMRDQEILQQLSDFAVDVAQAESLANAAVETANQAVTTANQATSTANTALTASGAAIRKADEAKATATQASQDAVDAMADAASAVNKADAADTTATTAMEIAADAATIAQGAEAAVANKQDKLVAGQGITIDGNTISATDGYSKTEIDNKISVIEAGIDANADAIQSTRADFIAADSDIHTILNNHASELTTLHNDVDDLGDQVSGIEEKIPGTASTTNPLITKQQLLDEEMDIREDLNNGLSELQTQITAQAAEIATKQNKLTAGSGITIDGDIISSTGGGGDFLPLSGGTITGKLQIDVGESPTTVGATRALGFTGTADGIIRTCWFSYMPQNYRLDVNSVHIYNTGKITPHGDGEIDLGGAYDRFNTVYTNKISSALSGAIIIPALSGTMARIEDIDAIGGDGTEGQVLTKTADGMAWQDASGGGGGLPDQTDNAGKFLTTDGTTLSWSDKPLVNNSDYATSIGIGSKATRGTAVVIGTGITITTGFSVTIGTNASTNTTSSVAIGYAAGASNYSIALGRQMSASAEHSIQIGCASGMISNTDPNTFKVYNGVDNYEMMDANGNVPIGRLTYITDQIGDISTALTAILGE